MIGLLVVGNVAERIVPHFIGGVLGGKLGAARVAVAVKLQAKRTPSRHPQIAEAQLGVDEVEVVVQTLATVRLEIGVTRGLVVPGPVGRAGFHGTEDMHQTGLAATRGQERLNPIFLAKVLLADVLDGQVGRLRHRFGGGPNLGPQGLCPLGVIEDPRVVGIQITRHAFGITQLTQAARDHDPIIAAQDTVQALGILLG